MLEHTANSGGDYILECRNISKAFGGTHALQNVQLTVERGHVHALIGENGAGKSTLMNIIIGMFKQDEGEIVFDGKPYSASGPAEASALGISMIHQELNTEPHLSVAENIFLMREDTIKRTFLLNKRETNRKCRALLEQYNISYNPRTLMGELTIAQAQMIEIIKAVSRESKLVIMDEPTSSLDNAETERLFATIRRLKSEGVTIIYISHRMEEIFQICDSYTVFRDGKWVNSGSLRNCSTGELISMMVGRNLENLFAKTECAKGEIVLQAENLCGAGFSDICFSVRQGEILGLSGLVGSGRSETMKAIFGLEKLRSGRIFLNGKQVEIKHPRQAIAQGIGMINEDRKNYGLCLHRSIRENLSLPNLRIRQKKLLINRKKEKGECQDFARSLYIKTNSLENDAYSLSGGNQQKVVIAKWLMSAPKLLIMDEPTRGVDVGAKQEIYALMSRLASEGLAIIMVSSDLQEVMGMSDRILVYHEGRLNGEFFREDIVSRKVSQEDILSKEFGN